ncbi:Rrf2 family transcriptional regulator [Caulobacter sp. 602-1]|uniref:RrF2 family transcriptional regulator n=1 Tax=Caulobacter sp. 602-1 TaxID=2492472 RepID=UPI001F303B8B|nr:Rrf2 family transcriptional regulator [Caulobacter sp. 602-1]
MRRGVSCNKYYYMKRDSRLSVALHVLLHMAQRQASMTSEEMAACAGTNPVVIRRTFAGLREAGIVASTKGHGGGWSLGRPLSQISLADVQDALDEPVIALGRAEDSPGCLIEQAVNAALDEAVVEARALLTKRLATVSLAELFGRVDTTKIPLPKDHHHV